MRGRSKLLCIAICLSIMLTTCTAADSFQEPDSRGKVAETQTAGMAVEKYYNSIGELSADADFVVAGECISAESFLTKMGTVWTKETYQVNEALSGNLDKNEIIVYVMGGEISIKNYLDTYEGPYKEDMWEACIFLPHKHSHRIRKKNLTADISENIIWRK
mgnify:CR=1 FL=1